MSQSIIVILRSTFTFFTLLVLARFMGKNQISQLTFFDYVNGITIGSIAATMSIDLDIETIPSMAGLLTWALWVLVLGILDLYSHKWRKIIDGRPAVVIQNGHIVDAKLKQLNYNIDDLRMQLRTAGVFNMADVEFALLEPNGSLSVLRKSQKEPLTPADMNIPTSYRGLPIELIQEGQIIDKNLIRLKLNKEWLEQQVKALNHKPDEVFYAEIDTSGSLYVDLRDDLIGTPQGKSINAR